MVWMVTFSPMRNNLLAKTLDLYLLQIFTFFFMLLNFKSSSIISLIYVSIYQKSIIVNHEHTFLLADVWRLGVDTACGSMKLMVGDKNQAR